MKKTALTFLSITVSVILVNHARADFGSSCTNLNVGFTCSKLGLKGTCVKKTSYSNLNGFTYECKTDPTFKPISSACLIGTSCTVGTLKGMCKSLSVGSTYCDTTASSGSTSGTANTSTTPLPDPNVSCLLSESSGTKREKMSMSDCAKLGGAPYALKNDGSVGEKVTNESCAGKTTPECQKLSNLTVNQGAENSDYTTPLKADRAEMEKWNSEQGTASLKELEKLTPSEKAAIVARYNATHSPSEKINDVSDLSKKNLDAVQVAEIKNAGLNTSLEDANNFKPTGINGKELKGADAYDAAAKQYNEDNKKLASLNKQVEGATKNAEGQWIGKNGVNQTELMKNRDDLEIQVKSEKQGLKVDDKNNALTTKDLKSKVKESEKEIAKKEKEKGKKEAEQDSDLDMRMRHADNYYGGRFGGHKKEFTDQVNQGAAMLSEGIKVFAQSAVEAKKLEAQSDLASKGQNATAADINKSRDDLKTAAKDGLNKSAWIEGSNATIQAVMMGAHLISMAKVQTKATRNLAAISKEKADAERKERPNHAGRKTSHGGGKNLDASCCI